MTSYTCDECGCTDFFPIKNACENCESAKAKERDKKTIELFRVASRVHCVKQGEYYECKLFDERIDRYIVGDLFTDWREITAQKNSVAMRYINRKKEQ